MVVINFVIKIINYIMNNSINILFISFLITWVIKLIYVKRVSGETFIWNPDEKIIENFHAKYTETIHLNIEDECYPPKDRLLISPNEIMINIKIYNCSPNGKRIKEGDPIVIQNRLTSKECIILYTLWPESWPQYVIEWKTPTFMKASLALSYRNNNNEQIKYKHTIFSALYYLFNRQ